MQNNIRALRLQRGMTQLYIAENLGYETHSIVAMWENGTRKPPADKLPQLAKLLGCTVDELLREEATKCQ